MLSVFRFGEPRYEQATAALSRRGDEDLARVEPAVSEILRAVRERGDQALFEFVERFESRTLHRSTIPHPEWSRLSGDVSDSLRGWIDLAATRIETYHRHQGIQPFEFEQDGVRLGQRVTPLRSVGVYAPGGKARYPSTVLMTAIPAMVAGVERIVLATPNPNGALIAAAERSGVTEIVDAGGAQAIAALAYGTETIAPVDKIVGPGNLYVACAKRLVFGHVDIDSIAGPSEILVVADDGADPAVVAADLLSQAEHDEAAYALLICLSDRFLHEVQRELAEQLERLPRNAIARASLEANGAAFVVPDLDRATELASTLAAEHLSLAVRKPADWMHKIRFAGAIFVGDHTPEAAGDYAAGPSHVLPTGGAARFSSPLGVPDFQVRSSIIEYSLDALAAQEELLTGLAEEESLEAHAEAVRVRIRRAKT